MKLIAVLLGSALWLHAGDFPAGQQVRVRMGQTLSSEKARAGDSWEGTLAADVVAGEKILARKGTPVRGRVVDANNSGRLSDPGFLRIQLTSIGGKPVMSRSISRRATGHTKRNVTAIGGGAAVGAAIGAIAGGGKGAAIGAGAGAAAGTAGAAATGKKDVRIPVESLLTFTIR